MGFSIDRAIELIWNLLYFFFLSSFLHIFLGLSWDMIICWNYFLSLFILLVFSSADWASIYQFHKCFLEVLLLSFFQICLHREWAVFFFSFLCHTSSPQANWNI
ncbi:hypothetical protein BDZ91DRAFT_447021 [Kalaharituber pfeilii]|nr:hypothetical protein BDZ91DRAFT_447021 [Kalaharituber pfeilii]